MLVYQVLVGDVPTLKFPSSVRSTCFNVLEKDIGMVPQLHWVKAKFLSVYYGLKEDSNTIRALSQTETCMAK